jgi:hypothetical protein
MDRTPQPIGADVVEPLGPHMLQQATNERLGGQGHGLPTLVLGVLVAAADLPIREGEEAVVGQRHPVDIAAQVVQDLLPAWRGRFTGDDPPFGPDHLGQGQVGTFPTSQIEKQPAQERREGLDGHQGGRAGGPPLGPVGGDPTGWHQTVHMWMIDEGPGPGVEDAENADEPPDIMWGCGERDERWGRGAEQNVVPVLLVAADKLPQFLGQGQDDMKGGDWEEFLPPRCQPHLGVMMVALGTTPGAAGVVGIVRLTAVITRPQMSAQGLCPAVDKIIHSAAMAGQEIRAKPLLIGRTLGSEDVRHLWHARAPEP